jgi:hypothetical protein
MCVFSSPDPVVPEPPPQIPEEPEVELGGTTETEKRKKKAQGLRQFRIPLTPDDIDTGAGLNVN